MLQVFRYANIFENDYTKLTKIMSEAYSRQLRKQNNLLDDGKIRYDEETLIRRLCFNSNNISKKIIYQNEIIGIFVLNKQSENNFELKMLFISPKYQNRGFGTTIWKDIENNFIQVKSWLVEVPDYSEKIHYYFTVKCGFYNKNIKEYADGSQVYVYEKLR